MSTKNLRAVSKPEVCMVASTQVAPRGTSKNLLSMWPNQVKFPREEQSEIKNKDQMQNAFLWTSKLNWTTTDKVLGYNPQKKKGSIKLINTLTWQKRHPRKCDHWGPIQYFHRLDYSNWYSKKRTTPRCFTINPIKFMIVQSFAKIGRVHYYTEKKSIRTCKL